MGSLNPIFGKFRSMLKDNRGFIRICYNDGAGDGGGGGGAGDGAGDGDGTGSGAGAMGGDGSGAGAAGGTGGEPQAFSWKSKLTSDMQNAPLLKVYDDSVEGLGKAMESYANLEKLLGHEKVVIPKGPEDAEGWNAFSKALGVPDKAEGYGLPDANLPEEMKGMAMDKNKFAEIAHSFKLTPSQVKGMWETYQQVNIDAYKTSMANLQAEVDQSINALRGEWGDAYDTNVELGQMVINKFTDGDQAASDEITALMMKSPAGIKFLSKIGNQFAENKIGEFQMKRFSLAPEEAQAEWDKIRMDQDHPYNNASAPQAERDAAIAHVNRLIAAVNRGKG
jgi:hypothetical protein